MDRRIKQLEDELALINSLRAQIAALRRELQDTYAKLDQARNEIRNLKAKNEDDSP